MKLLRIEERSDRLKLFEGNNNPSINKRHNILEKKYHLMFFQMKLIKSIIEYQILYIERVKSYYYYHYYYYYYYF